jgi:hypothetical protein
MDEFIKIVHDYPDLEGFPRYLCVDRSGVVKFWPRFHPDRHTVMMTARWGK